MTRFTLVAAIAEVKGPILDAQRFCQLDDTEDVGEDTPAIVLALDAGH